MQKAETKSPTLENMPLHGIKMYNESRSMCRFTRTGRANLDVHGFLLIFPSFYYNVERYVLIGAWFGWLSRSSQLPYTGSNLAGALFSTKTINPFITPLLIIETVFVTYGGLALVAAQ
ncbi:hypothetical protein VNO77_20169 [Canavalia gladiata]|uniref:Uncharacterized protein n=1 Tax=Canavalia gladiata TaxID=3824 RepID=A0AAN9QQA8_CANGL